MKWIAFVVLAWLSAAPFGPHGQYFPVLEWQAVVDLRRRQVERDFGKRQSLL